MVSMKRHMQVIIAVLLPHLTYCKKILEKLTVVCSTIHNTLKTASVTQPFLTWSASRRARAAPSQRKKDETQTAGRLTRQTEKEQAELILMKKTYSWKLTRACTRKTERKGTSNEYDRFIKYICRSERTLFSDAVCDTTGNLFQESLHLCLYLQIVDTVLHFKSFRNQCVQFESQFDEVCVTLTALTWCSFLRVAVCTRV